MADLGQRGTCSTCGKRRVICCVLVISDATRFQFCREDVAIYG